MKIPGPDQPESARERIPPAPVGDASIAQEEKEKKRKKKEKNQGQIAVSAAGSSARLFAAEDGCLWKDQKQFAGWRLRIGAGLSLFDSFPLLSSTSGAVREAALLIRSTNGTETSAAARFYSTPQFRLNKASCASADIFPSA